MTSYEFSTIWDENIDSSPSEALQWYLVLTTAVRVLRLADHQKEQALLVHQELRKLPLADAKSQVCSLRKYKIENFPF